MASQAQTVPAAETARASRRPGPRPDFATFGGILLAAAGIVGGLILEGGSLKDITQPTAAMIVLGGTFGAVLVNFPMQVVGGGCRRLMHVFFERSTTPGELIDKLVEYAGRARKFGIVSLEPEAEQIEDPFLRKALTLAVDGTDLQELRKMLELEIALAEHHAEQEAKVWEAAGGYSPTIGIIGAVLGLIQVMKNLADIDAVGHGIATAFVATVYGVAFANVFFLPAGNKIRSRAHRETELKELITEGVAAIVEGLNPKWIRSKLEAYQREEPKRLENKNGKTENPRAARKP